MAGLLNYLLSKLALEDTLPRLGFNNKIFQKTTKSLSCISKKVSFYIWLARNCSGWSGKTSLITIEGTIFSTAGSKNTNTSRDNQSSNKGFLNSQPTRNLRQSNQCTKHSGFFNKGNTCYANSILQALSTIPSF